MRVLTVIEGMHLILVVLSLFGEYTVLKHASTRVYRLRTPAVLRMSTVYLVVMIPSIFIYSIDDRRIYQTILNTQTKRVLIFLKY